MKRTVAEALRDRDRTDGELAQVLIVDNDEANRAALRRLLEAEGGYAVAEASDGDTAYDLLRASPAPLVVLARSSEQHPAMLSLFHRVVEDPDLANCHVYVCLANSARALPPAFDHLLAELDAPVLRYPYDRDTLGIVVAAAGRRAAALGEQSSLATGANVDRTA